MTFIYCSTLSPKKQEKNFKKKLDKRDFLWYNDYAVLKTVG